MLLQPILRFIRETSGGIAVAFAIAAPALLCAVGVAADLAHMSYVKSRLQTTADGAAISGAREMTLANATRDQVDAAVASLVAQHAAADRQPTTHITAVDFKAGEVTVDLAQTWTPFFVHFIDSDAVPVRARAKARLLASATKVCVLTLSPSDSKSVHLTKHALLTANDCGVYSNSKHGASIQVDKNARIQARMVCTVGGVQMAKSTSITPAPISDCPALPDPLKDRPAPSFSGCDFNNFKIATGVETLSPGVYCGGLEISGTAKIEFAPGIYVMKNGRLTITDKATAEGEDVGFYLTGKDAVIDFTGDTTIRLSGPESGEMAGLLFFEDRDVNLANKHLIRSTRADKLVGTIYLPRGLLFIDPDAKVAEKSAYTAIIAYELAIDESPELILNSNYGDTDVPVPDGIKTSGTVVLSE
jgi:Flp pilus assembly protein TadG